MIELFQFSGCTNTGLCRIGPPADLIIELWCEFSIKNFGETCFYEGQTAVWASEHFRRVSTIELIKKDLFSKIKKRLG